MQGNICKGEKTLPIKQNCPQLQLRQVTISNSHLLNIIKMNLWILLLVAVILDFGSAGCVAP